MWKLGGVYLKFVRAWMALFDDISSIDVESLVPKIREASVDQRISELMDQGGIDIVVKKVPEEQQGRTLSYSKVLLLKSQEDEYHVL
jgi:hypothetical protein